MLFRSVKRSTLASIALDKADWPTFEATMDRCIDIVNYLDETLDHKYPISRDLSRMYDYFTYEMGRVKIGRNKAVLEQLRPMLADMRDTFRAAEKNSGSQEKRA